MTPASPKRVPANSVPIRRGRCVAKLADELGELLALDPGEWLLITTSSLEAAQAMQGALRRLCSYRGVRIRTRTEPCGLYVTRVGR